MPDSLASAQTPGRVLHICTQAELSALLASPNASASSPHDPATVELPRRRAKSERRFVGGSEVEFQTLGPTIQTAPDFMRVMREHAKILHRLHERTKTPHGDVGLHTLRVMGEGEKAVPYVMDIPEYPWIDSEPRDTFGPQERQAPQTSS